jgi:ketosteroid isomerase-like protein
MEVRMRAHLLLPAAGYLIFFVSTLFSSDMKEELLNLEKEWQQAITANTPEAIAGFVTEDYVIVSGDGTIIDQSVFLNEIRSGSLIHQAMNLENPRVRFYDNTAIITGIATSTGSYKGQPFSTRERATDVFVKQQGKWKCAITHLTSISEK